MAISFKTDQGKLAYEATLAVLTPALGAAAAEAAAQAAGTNADKNAAGLAAAEEKRKAVTEIRDTLTATALNSKQLVKFIGEAADKLATHNNGRKPAVTVSISTNDDGTPNVKVDFGAIVATRSSGNRAPSRARMAVWVSNEPGTTEKGGVLYRDAQDAVRYGGVDMKLPIIVRYDEKSNRELARPSWVDALDNWAAERKIPTAYGDAALAMVDDDTEPVRHPDYGKPVADAFGADDCIFMQKSWADLVGQELMWRVYVRDDDNVSYASDIAPKLAAAGIL